MFYINYQKDLKEARDKLTQIHSQIYKSKYGDIEYLLVGEGPTVLVSHGVTGGVDQGLGLADMYIGKDYKMLYVSRFGYLKSTMPKNASAKIQAEVYKELLDYLQIERAFVVGNSAGGPSAMNFAIDYSEKCCGLILISSAVPAPKTAMPPDIIFQSDFIYWVTTKLAGRSLMKMFIPLSIIDALAKQDIQKLMKDIFVGALPISKRSKGIIFDNKVSTPSVNTISFERINVPTLIIHATDDPAPPIAGARVISAKIKNSKLITYDGGHIILHHEMEIREEIKNFIQDVEKNLSVIHWKG